MRIAAHGEGEEHRAARTAVSPVWLLFACCHCYPGPGCLSSAGVDSGRVPRAVSPGREAPYRAEQLSQSSWRALVWTFSPTGGLHSVISMLHRFIHSFILRNNSKNCGGLHVKPHRTPQIPPSASPSLRPRAPSFFSFLPGGGRSEEQVPPIHNHK